MEKLWNRIVDFFQDIPGFIENNSANPIFWIIVIIVFVGVFFAAINKFGEK